MSVPYPEFAGLVIVDATGSKERLNAEVWRHARLAEAKGLALVVEVYARSVLASRRLTEWWKSGSTLMQDTLSGIYLLRVDLQTFGPEAVLRLTPYAVVGAPLFVGWNPIGQVCSRTQFEELTPEAMALPLSAFAEDVLAGRPHSLNPVPSLGSAERTREAAALRRVGQAWLKDAPKRPPEVLPGDGGNLGDQSSTKTKLAPSFAPLAVAARSLNGDKPALPRSTPVNACSPAACPPEVPAPEGAVAESTLSETTMPEITMSEITMPDAVPDVAPPEAAALQDGVAEASVPAPSETPLSETTLPEIMMIDGAASEGVSSESHPLVGGASDGEVLGTGPRGCGASEAALASERSETAPLDRFLGAARGRFGALEDRLGTELRFQVTNLQSLDRSLDALSEEERLVFAKEFGAVLAVYVGDTIRRRVTADWVWEENEGQRGPAGKLVLTGQVLGQPLRTEPIEWVVATLGDPTRSLYGQALGWCRVV